ncbi:6-phosphogluconate dehydrogenase C-terminal domain-like protein [Ascodesmis nigricans]|uniref:6-phosphogluconate dehydrogenase C-terminal domain-like protein n=1 Tax=Ascodesmis nigricans TaxID=341454 RepID=A0A4S2MYA2_9PEZI|nr:6-phosphogluconate dehydrogenase C-terminal domain-like protein [Ascodesmis nigricans]
MSESSFTEPNKPVVAILSLGEMGFGHAQLLKAHGYRVLTNLEGRSEATQQRALQSGVELITNDISLITETDIFLSIIPPSEALSTAQRIATAYQQTFHKPLYYVDLNALSPNTVKEVSQNFNPSWPIHFIDGAIIGPPARPPTPSNPSWYVPRIVISGAHELPTELRSLLVMKHIGPEIGQASALKMSFATLFKGFTSLALLSFTTAERHGVYDALREEMDEFFPPFGGMAGRFLEGNMKGVPKKAYRWVTEMEEIDATHRETGFDEGVFEAVARVYGLVDKETEVGRRRAKDVEVEEVLKSVDEALKGREK